MLDTMIYNRGKDVNTPIGDWMKELLQPQGPWFKDVLPKVFENRFLWQYYSLLTVFSIETLVRMNCKVTALA